MHWHHGRIQLHGMVQAIQRRAPIACFEHGMGIVKHLSGIGLWLFHLGSFLYVKKPTPW
jgi:hypothetical protein